ncbi:hypothetical protein HF086_001667 [Spodoptera exigua]|uniref:glutathione transferase n=1 Tax=Spodoptera exigua TaxID=7107 RepID=A0A922MN47_SPOEX|nr:hypothetical protein HF086_001667 [Spodoptera exigua]
MPKYVFTYFNGKGVGEPSRLLLAFGGEGFEDHRVAEIDWPNFKPRGAIAYYEEDEAVKKTRYAEYNKNDFPNLLKNLNDIIIKNNGHIALGKDLLVVPDLEKKYPAFQKVVDNVYSIPKVKAYADAVGPTEF